MPEKKEKINRRITSDFMLDPRKKRFEVEFYSTITNKITKGGEVTFQRLAVAIGMILGAFIFGIILFNLPIIYQSSLLFFPFVLLMSATIYSARQFLMRVGDRSRLGYALTYLFAGKKKASSSDDKLRIVRYDSIGDFGVGVLDNKCKVIGYEVEGNFSKTMFQSDTIAMKRSLAMYRERLDGILEVGILSIENTDFRKQKEYYQSCAEKGGAYQRYLAENFERDLAGGRNQEKIEKNLLFFALRNDEEFEKVNFYIQGLKSKNILRKAVPLSMEELREFVVNY